MPNNTAIDTGQYDGHAVYADADIAAQVKERDAFLFRTEFNPATGLKTFTRGWRVTQGLVERVRDFLYKYGDGDHYTTVVTEDEDGNPVAPEITNPAIADGVAQPGVWKVTKIFEIPERAGDVYETMTQQIEGHELEVLSENSCAYHVTRTYYYDQTAVPNAPAASSGIVYSVEGISRDRETGLYDYVIECRETMTLKMGAWTSMIDSSQSTASTVWKGVREDDLDQDGNPLSGLDNMARVKGKIKREHRTKNNDCTHDISQDITDVVDQFGSGHEVRHDETSDEITHTENPNQLDEPEAVTGQIRDVSSRPTAAGNWQTSDRTRTAKDQPSESGEDRADITSEEQEHTHGPDVSAFATDGTSVSFSNRPTIFGDKQTSVRVTTVHDQVTTSGDERHDQSTVEVEHTANSAPEAQVTAGVGTIVQVDNSPTQFKNRTRTRKRIVTAKPQSSEIISEIRADQQSRTIVGTHQSIPSHATTGGNGTIERASSRKDEFDLNSNSFEEITAKPQQSTVTWMSKKYEFIHIWWKHQIPGYGQNLAIAYQAKKTVNVSTYLDEFGLENGTLSASWLRNGAGDDARMDTWINTPQWAEETKLETRSSQSATGTRTEWRYLKNWRCVQHFETHAEMEHARDDTTRSHINHGATYNLTNGVARTYETHLKTGKKLYSVWMTFPPHEAGPWFNSEVQPNQQ